MLRGQEAPMDFQMAQSIEPDESKPWMAAFQKYSSIQNTVEKMAKQQLVKKDAASLNKRVVGPLEKKATEQESRVVECDEYEYPRKRKKLWKNEPEPRHFQFLKYLQLCSFAVCVGLLIYGAVVVVWTIQHDLRIKQFEFQQEITHQIHECTHQYLKNRCDPETRVPAMELQCLEWQRCMQKDPMQIARLKLGANTLAEIINNLIEPLSFKSMVQMLITGFYFWIVSRERSVRTFPSTMISVILILLIVFGAYWLNAKGKVAPEPVVEVKEPKKKKRRSVQPNQIAEQLLSKATQSTKETEENDDDLVMLHRLAKNKVKVNQLESKTNASDTKEERESDAVKTPVAASEEVQEIVQDKSVVASVTSVQSSETSVAPVKSSAQPVVAPVKSSAQPAVKLSEKPVEKKAEKKQDPVKPVEKAAPQTAVKPVEKTPVQQPVKPVEKAAVQQPVKHVEKPVEKTEDLVSKETVNFLEFQLQKALDQKQAFETEIKQLKQTNLLLGQTVGQMSNQNKQELEQTRNQLLAAQKELLQKDQVVSSLKKVESDLLRAREEFRKTEHQFKDERSNYLHKLRQLEDGLTKMQTEMTQMNKQNAQDQVQMAQYRLQVQDLEKQLALGHAAHHGLEKDNKELQSKIGKLSMELDAVQTSSRNSVVEQNRLESKIHDLQSILKSKEDLESENQDLINKIKASEQSNKKTEEELSKAKQGSKRADELQKKVQELERKLKGEEESKNRLKSTLDALKAQSDEMQVLVDQSAKSLEEYQHQAHSVGPLNELLVSYADELEALQMEKKQLKETIHQLSLKKPVYDPAAFHAIDLLNQWSVVLVNELEAKGRESLSIQDRLLHIRQPSSEKETQAIQSISEKETQSSQQLAEKQTQSTQPADRLAQPAQKQNGLNVQDLIDNWSNASTKAEKALAKEQVDLALLDHYKTQQIKSKELDQAHSKWTSASSKADKAKAFEHLSQLLHKQYQQEKVAKSPSEDFEMLDATDWKQMYEDKQSEIQSMQQEIAVLKKKIEISDKIIRTALKK